MQDFEKLAAQFVSNISSTVPKHLVGIVFSSPLSARDSDESLLWHEGYRKKNRSKLLLGLFLSLIVESLKGVAKIITRYEPFGYALYGKVDDAILVVASTCGSATNDGGYETTYVLTDKDDAKFVFGHAKKCGKIAKKVKPLPTVHKIAIAGILARSGIRAFVNVKGDIADKILLALEWLSWVSDFQWMHNYYLEDALSATIERYKIKKVGCIHEMHSYSRIVWYVAAKHKIKGYTVQHASISGGKRWYFPHSEEIDGGLALPHTFYVFEERMASLLKPSFTKTTFELGLSNRYSRWISAKPIPRRERGRYLFVTSLAWFDNKVVIEALKDLLSKTKERLPIRLRLHPNAELDLGLKRWIAYQVKKHNIELSNRSPLSNDIEEALVVIGMTTTVLEEAILLDRPVIQLTHPDYLSCIDLDGIEGFRSVRYSELSPDMLHSFNIRTDAAAVRKRLGLDQRLVTFKQLFS